MKKIMEFFEVHVDKVLHFVVCVLLMLVVTWMAEQWVGFDARTATAMAMVVTIILGMGKEIWDEYRGHGFSNADFFADLCGVGMGCLLELIVNS